MQLILERTIHPPLVCHLDPTSGIRARSLICGLHQPERMASSWLDVCETHIFYGTNFAHWKNHMLDHFCAKGPKFWWIVVVGFTRDLDESNLTQAQGDCLTLDDKPFVF